MSAQTDALAKQYAVGQLGGMGMLPMSLSASGGPAYSGASSDSGALLNLLTSTPFNFDDSGWVINFRSPVAGNQTASGSTDANAGSGTAAGVGTPSSKTWMLIAGGVALWLLTRKS